MSIAVIDNASDTPAIQCFNRLVERTGRVFTYHIPAVQGIESLRRLKRPPEAIFLFGSYSNIHERQAWHKQVADYSLNALESGVPILGICFGHQLMADALGGEVSHIAQDKPHKLTRRFETKDDSFTFVMEHSYEISRMPASLVTVGASPACRHDFVAHAQLPYWGVQGHPEASWDFVEATQDGLLSEAEYLSAQKDGDRFIDMFLGKFLT